ncbi:S1C family serine protease [Mariniblastus sp.]|nr:S1C family serine protease [bacterium]MDA7910246.1 S1C family serine protease [bacterium]MDA7928811.1 S1C family serine protease [Mariniblastus sp.]MDC3223513.1 S1C family serine protease [Mariniblastus sp.]
MNIFGWGMALLMGCVVLVCGNHLAFAQQKDQPSFIDQAISNSQPKMVKVFGASAGKVEGFATGIIVSKDGLILSSQGVFLDGRQVKVVLADGAEHMATILKRDRETQLSLLKIQADTPSFFELSEESVGEKGDWVIALSNAFKVADKDEPVSAMLGVISLRTTMEARLTKRDVAYRGELVLIDAITSNPGASGGAVVTPRGNLVGIVGKIINSSETNTRLNYAVPSSVLFEFVTGKASVTGETQPVLEQQDVEFGVVLFTLGGRNNPAYIDRVVRGSPAAKAKLKSDDMIVSIAGEKIGNLKDYAESLKSLRPEEEVLMIVKRGVEMMRVRIAPRLKK